MGNFDTKFGSARQDWETPDSVFVPLDKEFGFTLDVCASVGNARCERFFTVDEDGLVQRWGGICWMNPPFWELGKWVKKAYEESRCGSVVVALLPSRTNTNWWHDYVMKGEVRFIRGRPKFKGAEHGLPQPLSIVVWKPHVSA